MLTDTRTQIAARQAGTFRFACPACRAPLKQQHPDLLRCPVDNTSYARVEGIWRCLAPGRATHYARFLSEYETVRRTEGRGSADPAYYRALPYSDLTGRFRNDWRIRARSFEVLVERVVQPLEQAVGRWLRVADLGAGNGWLAYRLAQRGHVVAAVDLRSDSFDGLGAHMHYDASFVPVQAEFDRLPFEAGQADLVVFNASLHYAADYQATLTEALRVLRPGGRLAIVDTPIYHDASSGARMVREREAYFEHHYGFPSNTLPSEHYLTYARLTQLGNVLGLQWRYFQPFYGWRWALRPLVARLRGHREPARFAVIAGEQLAAMHTGER